MKKIIHALMLVGCLLVFFGAAGISAFAETPLPEGAVKGLPERLAALDDQGNAVNSATGEYFFRVENMKFGETYSKNIQLMNLREDYSYHIYFYTEPLFNKGEIDLEKGCECVFYLDGTEFYRGDVNGNGSMDLQTNHFDCGNYAPGESHTLRCEITWNDLDVLRNVSNGHRLVDNEGEHILVGPDSSGSVEGEIEFKWVFYAQVGDESSSSPDSTTDTYVDGRGYVPPHAVTTVPSVTDTPDTPDTPHRTDTEGFFPPFTGFLARSGAFWLVCMGVIAVMIAVLLVLMHKKNKKQKR